jgi:hypothetical protein
MALRDSITALCESWEDVVVRVGDDLHVLKVLLYDLLDRPDDTGTMRKIVRLLDEVLPPDHPVLLAVSLDDDRSPAAALRWTRTIAELARLLDD